MIVRAPTGELEACVEQKFGEHLGVAYDLLAVGLEAGAQGLAEGYGLGCYDVRRSSLARIMPPLGPRRVLWVVVVTTWA